MPYHIALPSGDKYVIVRGELFNIRSNAQKYAERMGWKDFFIATDEQRAIIESGADFGEASASSDIIPPEPETILMKEKDVPSGQRPRKLKRK
mgnify:CR=1 FL=1